MSLKNMTITPGWEKYMTKEYVDLVERGPYGKQKKVSEMGSFKEVLEEHPMCAGCAMTLFIRLTMVGLPNPEHTILIGTAGCGKSWRRTRGARRSTNACSWPRVSSTGAYSVSSNSGYIVGDSIGLPVMVPPWPGSFPHSIGARRGQQCVVPP